MMAIPSLLTLDMDAELERQIGIIPGHCRSGLLSYLRYGRRPGHFLLAVLSNNLAAACGAADNENRIALNDYVSLLYDCAPRAAWGSPDNVEQWIARGAELRKAEAGS